MDWAEDRFEIHLETKNSNEADNKGSVHQHSSVVGANRYYLIKKEGIKLRILSINLFIIYSEN